jgi:preprotein translocase subunit SecF
MVKAGWYANIALAINLLFLFGILASLGAVLTLPGIAGIVLTMGTAVDANIIIYERAKKRKLEELKIAGVGCIILDECYAHFNRCCVVYIWFRTN